MLVRQGHAAQLYQGADTGVDPQKALAPATSAIYKSAQAQGLTFVGLYVYPPILADLLLPFTFLTLPAATHLWLLTNGVFLLLTALMVIRLLRTPVLSFKAALIMLSLACFTPALQCLVDGQITIFLLLLWAAGMLLYQEENDFAAGAVFALATAIKLTPAIVLLPFLIWRKWRVTGAFALTLLLLALVSLWVDSPQAMHTYFARVLPAMSGSIPAYSNYSLPSSTQRLLALMGTGTILPSPPSMPAGIVLAGRTASGITAAALFLLIARAGRRSGRREHLMVLALLSLMAPILSPVSWFHAYSTAFLAFALLWNECFSKPTGAIFLSALTAVSLLLGSAVSENLIPLLLFSGHAVLSSLLHSSQLLAAIGLVFFRLWRLRAGQPDAEAGEHGSVHPSTQPLHA